MHKCNYFQKFQTAGGFRSLRLFLFLAIIFVMGTAGCGDNRQTIVIAGSTSVQPLMEKIVEKYRKEHPALKINVEGGGSGAGIMAVYTGTAHLGMASRKLKVADEKEKTLTPITIAYDAIIMVTHVDNPVTTLTVEQIRGLFSGKLKSWKDVGGLDREVHLIIREEGSGTRSAFDELVMLDGKTEVEIDPFALVQDSMGGVREVVKNDLDAIGFISMGGISKEVKVIKLNQVEPVFENIKNHQYQLVRPYLLLVKGPLDAVCKDLVDFVLSPAVEKIMQEEGSVSARQ